MPRYSASFQADPTGYDASFTYAFGRLTLADVGVNGCDTETITMPYYHEADAVLPDDIREGCERTRTHAQPILGRYPTRDAAEAALRKHYHNLDIWLEAE